MFRWSWEAVEHQWRHEGGTSMTSWRTFARKHGVKIVTRKVLKKFAVRLFTCDSPARSFVTSTISHNGKKCCTKYAQTGRYTNKRFSFSKLVKELRTSSSFKNMFDAEHHSLAFKEQQKKCHGFGIVSQFPLDPTHLL